MKLSKYMSHVFVLKRNHMPRDIHICLFLYPKAAQYVRWTLQCHEPMPRQHPKTNSLHQTPLEFAPYICFILGNQLHTKNKPDQEWIYIYIYICIYHIHIRLYTLNTSNIYLDTRPIRVKYRRSRVQKTCPKNMKQQRSSFGCSSHLCNEWPHISPFNKRFKQIKNFLHKNFRMAWP